MNRKKVYPFYLALIPVLMFTVFFIIPSTVGYLYAFTNWSAARILLHTFDVSLPIFPLIF